MGVYVMDLDAWDGRGLPHAHCLLVLLVPHPHDQHCLPLRQLTDVCRLLRHVDCSKAEKKNYSLNMGLIPLSRKPKKNLCAYNPW